MDEAKGLLNKLFSGAIDSKTGMSLAAVGSHETDPFELLPEDSEAVTPEMDIDGRLAGFRPVEEDRAKP